MRDTTETRAMRDTKAARDIKDTDVISIQRISKILIA